MLHSRTIGIIGLGRVGRTLAAAFTDAGHRIVSPPESAEIVILSVPDDALGSVVAALDAKPGQVVVHTSGAYGTGILGPAVAKGARPLAMHPAMTFTGGPEDLDRLRKGIAFGLTAPDDVRPLAEALVRDLGGTPEWIAEDRRTLYHAALAHGANHLVTLVNDAMDLLRAAGVREPDRVLDPLLHAALDNVLRLGDAALTGPVARGDSGTVRAHLDALPADTVEVYRALARRTARRAGREGVVE